MRPVRRHDAFGRLTRHSWSATASERGSTSWRRSRQPPAWSDTQQCRPRRHSAPPTELRRPDDPAARHRRRDDPAEPRHRRRRTAPTSRRARPAPRFNKTVADGLRRRHRRSRPSPSPPILLAMRTEPHVADEPARPTTQISVIPPPPDPSAHRRRQDTPIPFTASASCPPGSTAAQAVAGDDPTRAWVCVRGGVDGQVLTLELGRTMVDHRGVPHARMDRRRRLRNRPVAGPPRRDPGAVDLQRRRRHGGHPAHRQRARRSRASDPASRRAGLQGDHDRAGNLTRTSRFGAQPDHRRAPDGLLDTILGPPPAPPGGTPAPHCRTPPGPADDPADNTFAVSSVKILGHPPQ